MSFRILDLFSGLGGFSIAARNTWGEDIEIAAFCEIDRQCHHVLRRHFPDVPIFEDVRELNAKTIPGADAIDLICFGSPCQDWSVAGLRQGLAGDRSSLFMEAVRLMEELRPSWFLFENVPGLLSCWSAQESPPDDLPEGCEWEVDEIADFGVVLSEFSRLGYWYSGRLLDAQYYGLAQRRQRMFIVGGLGTPRAATLLFEPESLPGNPPPSRKEGERITQSLTRSLGGGGADDNRAQGGFYVPETVETLAANCGPKSHDAGNFSCNQAVDAGHILAFGGNNTSGPIEVATALNACKTGSGRQDFETETFIMFDTAQITSKENRCNPQPGDPCHPLASSAHPPAVAIRTVQTSANGIGVQDDLAHTLDVANGQAVAFGWNKSPSQTMQVGEVTDALQGGPTSNPAVAYILHGADKTVSTATETNCCGSLRTKAPGSIENSSTTVIQQQYGCRRIMPIEAERLQGLPDNYTAWGVNENGERVQISDSQRYRMIGNGLAIPVVEWIITRIRDAEQRRAR